MIWGTWSKKMGGNGRSNMVSIWTFPWLKLLTLAISSSRRACVPLNLSCLPCLPAVVVVALSCIDSEVAAELSISKLLSFHRSGSHGPPTGDGVEPAWR